LKEFIGGVDIVWSSNPESAFVHECETVFF